MEELAKLGAQRGNPEYLEGEYGEGDARGAGNIRAERDGYGAGNSREGETRRDRETREQIYMQTAAGGSLKGAGAGESFRRQASAGRGAAGYIGGDGGKRGAGRVDGLALKVLKGNEAVQNSVDDAGKIC